MALPNGADLINRLNLDDPSGKLKAFADPIAASALDTIRSLTGLALPVATIASEFPFVASYNQTVITDKWPVTSIQRVLWITQPLKVGTLADLYTGIADVAIAARGDGLEMAWNLLNTDRRGILTVDYTAGYNTLPDDLREAWNQIAMQYYRDTKLAGIDETTMNRNTTKYSRAMPPMIASIIRKYQRFPLP